LKKCENIPISIQDKKGISGGEKRRLAFACEVLTNPLILFCDEPTSGLDSFIALSVVECMKNLAKQGRTIICTIHQPSSEIFELFDRLCLLSEGKLAFNGMLDKSYGFFEDQGFKVPVNYNPADFYIKTLACVPSDRQNSLNRINVSISLCTTLFSCAEYFFEIRIFDVLT
jgi:ABC-type multidrug transport system ATPase subunit